MSEIILNDIVSAATPAAGKKVIYSKSGGIYFKDDAGVETMFQVGPSTGYLLPPSPYYSTTALELATFPAWNNPVNATIVKEATGGLYMSEPAEAANELHIREKNLDYSPPYQITFMVIPTAYGNYNRFGITLRYSGDTEAIFFGLMCKDDGPYISAHKYTSVTVFDGVYEETIMRGTDAPHWFQVEDDGTYYYWRFSNDGIHFTEVSHVSNTDWLSSPADKVGLTINGERGSDFAISGWFLSYLEESLA